MFYVIYRKPYIQLDFNEGIYEFVKDVFLGSTFPGSWFISALVVSVAIVFYTSKYIHPTIIFVVTLLISAFTLYPEIFPASALWVHEWYETNIRPEMNLSFPFALVWISMGQLMALHYYQLSKYSSKFLPLSLILAISCYIIFVISDNQLVSLFTKYLATASVFTCFMLIQLADKPIYKILRNYSILIFFFHFSIAGKKGLFLSYLGDSLAIHWGYYLFVVMVSILFAQSILYLEQKKNLSFLKYLH